MQRLYLRKPKPGKPASPIWQGQFIDANGRRHRISTGCTRQSDAAKVLAECERDAATAAATAEAAAGLAPHAARKTVEDALDHLVNFEHTGRRGKAVAAGTRTMWEQKAAHLSRLLKDCGGCAVNDRGGTKVAECDAEHGSVRLAELRRAHVLTYVDNRLKEGAARATVAKELSTLAAALKGAADREWMSEPAAIAAMPKFSATSKPKTRWLTPEEFPKLLAALDTTTPLATPRGTSRRLLSDIERARLLAHRRAEVERRQRFLWVACYTGAELSVLESLDWDDIDLARGSIRLRGTKTEARDRTIPLDRGLAAQLTTTPEAHRVGLVLGGWSNVRRDLAAACARAGIARVSPHSFRHTFASWLVQRGVDLFVVAKLMGHGSTAMVQRHYGHLSPKNYSDAIALLPSFPGITEKPSPVETQQPEPPDWCAGDVPERVETGGARGVSALPVRRPPTSRNKSASVEDPRELLVPRDGVEPPTRGFSVRCSTS
jgi:integrase